MTKIINFATIGSGAIVDSFLAGAAHDKRFRHAAVYSRTLERGTSFARSHGVDKIYASLEELAADKEIDAVYIASPNSCHCEQTLMMLSAGKHVLCEKPLAPTVEEAQRMIAAARSHGVVLMEAMKTTLLPNFSAVRDALPRIGKVRRYTAQFCQYSSRFDKFLAGEVENAFSPEMKGGALLDLGVYGIAPLIHLFGEPQAVVSSAVRMKPGGVVSDEGIDVQGTLMMKYPDMEAVVYYSKIADSYLPLEIQGDKGCITVAKLSQMIAPKIKFRPLVAKRKPGEPTLVVDDSREEDLAVPTISDNMYYEVKEFIDVIESDRIESSVNTFERSLAVLRVCEA